MTAKTVSEMGNYRAIMTTTDRERIGNPESVEPDKRYQSVTRVRSRIEELSTDVELLEENHPELLEELRDVVCEE